MNKRRGRKPKGGKIIEVPSDTNKESFIESNIILHLKCNRNDICPRNDDNKVEPYGFETEDMSLIDVPVEAPKKDLWSKVKALATELEKNQLSCGQSACFWCTYPFNTPTIYIPKHQLGDTYQCYGCFCSPACATAYLFNENIEQSAKFERYALLNHMYGEIFEYETNISPAPDPHYTLDKFYGKLTIEEYRQTFRSKRQLLVIDKPISRCLPEIYEDSALEPSETYGIKMRKRNTKSKCEIMKEKFMGLAK